MGVARQGRWLVLGWMFILPCLAVDPTGTVQVVIHCPTPGARVYLDEKELGRAGQELAVPYGLDLHLTVRAPHHVPETLFLPCLVPGDPALDISVNLAPQPAALRIRAQSPNRMTKISRGCLTLNGEDLGEVYLPFETNNLPAGRCRISLSVAGFMNPAVQELNLEPGQQASTVVELAYEEAFLVFNIVPTQATVKVAGDVVDSPDHAFRVVPNRFYVIQVQAPGYHGTRFEAAAMPGERRMINLRLTPRTYLVFELSPPEAVVFMQGRRLTERVLEVTGGQAYRLEVRAPGYEPSLVVITPEPGERHVIQVNLKKKGLW